MKRLLCFGALLLAATPIPAVAGDPSAPALHESEGSIANVSASSSEPREPFRRPLDDSDPEMHELMVQFFAATPCAPGHGLCAAALSMLTGGGDRLASYLIAQHEASLAEGYPNRGTYLRLLGHTESETAHTYLATRVESLSASFEDGSLSSVEQQDFIFAIESLGRTRAPEVADEALALFERIENPAVRVRAVNAFDRWQSKHGADPAMAARFVAVRDTAPSEPGFVPSGADRQLSKALTRLVDNPGTTYP